MSWASQGVVVNGAQIDIRSDRVTIFVSSDLTTAHQKLQNIYAVTAGHCGHTNSAWFQGQGDQSSNGPAICTIRTNSEYDVSGAISNCDCASIGPLPAGKATAGVFVNNNATYYFKRVAFENDIFMGITSGVGEEETDAGFDEFSRSQYIGQNLLVDPRF